MADNEILAPATRPLDLAVLILPQSSILEVASTLDPLRAANRHLGHEAYRWRIISPDGAPVPLTCGIELPAAGPFAKTGPADALFVIAGFRQAEVATRPLVRDLRRLSHRFRLIAGVDAGPWVLARAGLLAGHRATTHWEDLEDLAAAHPEIDVVPDRYVRSGPYVTIGGAAPASDFMLHLIGSRHGTALARQVAASFLTTARSGAEPQVAPSGRDTRLDPRVARAVSRMEARLDSPEPATTTATAVGLTARHLETLFRRDLGLTPGAYALSLRLQTARRLVTDTRHPMADIALRTGFSSPATLCRAFHRHFGYPPGALRRNR